MDLPVFDPIEYDFDTERLRRLVEDYKERVSSGLKSGMTLVEMESEWSKLIRDTKEIYSQISGKLIEDAEDSDFIRKKNRVPRAIRNQPHQQPKSHNPIPDHVRGTSLFTNRSYTSRSRVKGKAVVLMSKAQCSAYG